LVPRITANRSGGSAGISSTSQACPTVPPGKARDAPEASAAEMLQISGFLKGVGAKLHTKQNGLRQVWNSASDVSET